MEARSRRSFRYGGAATAALLTNLAFSWKPARTPAFRKLAPSPGIAQPVQSPNDIPCGSCRMAIVSPSGNADFGTRIFAPAAVAFAIDTSMSSTCTKS